MGYLHEQNKQKYHFFKPFRTEQPIAEHLKEYFENIKKKIHE